MSQLCLTLCRSTLAANLEDLRQNPADLAELRIDLLDDAELDQISDFPAKTDIPLILTCRKVIDGGLWSGDASERESLLLKSMEGSFSYIDLEEDEYSEVLVDKAAEKSIKIIRSIHDFKKVPGNLFARLQEMLVRGELVKAAVMPQGIADVLILFKIAQRWKEIHPTEDNLILLGMGAFGVATRILAQKMGCFLSFCSPGNAEAAPGHMSFDILYNLYRVHEINNKTRIFGIIGNPVLHTRSPQIHNPGFKTHDMNAVYVPFTVDDVPSFFELAEFLDIKGFSVTVPHKLAVRDLLHKEDPAVTAIASCNTVVKTEFGWEGYNTDAEGFILPLLKLSGNLKGQKAAVIGAGGAARAIVYALLKEGCDVSIFNRTESRAAALAGELGGSGYSLEKLKSWIEEGKSYDLLIQTSSVGMHGTEGPSNPIPFYKFTGRELVYDIIYTPPVTDLMQKAIHAGAKTLGGMPMLQEQARAQFRFFTGKELS